MLANLKTALLSLLVAPMLLTQHTGASPTQLEERQLPNWEISFCPTETPCIQDPMWGNNNVCIQHGGQSFWAYTRVGCRYTTWSGTNCAGSSKTFSPPNNQDSYYPVTFGSVSIAC